MAPVWVIALLALSLILNVVCITTCVVVWRRAAGEAAQAQQVQHKMQHLEQQIGIATSGAIGMGHRIVALEQKLHSLQEKQDNMGGSEVFAYSQALQMFEQGADVATVASNCGFSSSEAQLMALVQKQMKTAKTSTPAIARKKAAPSHHE